MTVSGQDFWSRRKALVAEEAAQDAQADEQPAVLDDLSDEEVLAALELPDPDTLMLGDDIKAFMAKAVPEHIRRRALRRLWRVNPVLANLDGLNDYDQDFTDHATVVSGMQTAYQVGKGMLAHVQEIARQAEALAADASDDAADLMQPDPTEAETVVSMAAEDAEVTKAEATETPRRRMRITYDPSLVAGVET